MELTLSVGREDSCDVAVVGGGTAGVFAAISAARCGAKTVLIEKNARIGGTVTGACVNFPGLFFAWGKQIIAGPCWEAILRTAERGGAVLPEITYKPQRHWHEQIRVNRLVYTHVLYEMCREAGVLLRTGTMLSSAEESENEVRLLLTDKSGLRLLRAKTAIDATGDANLVTMLGCPTVKSDPQQPATLQHHLAGYHIGDVEPDDLRVKLASSSLGSRYGYAALTGYLHKGILDIHTDCRNADTSEGRTALEEAALTDLTELLAFLRTVKGLENLHADWIADETGVRESCRVLGEHTVTAEEYLAGIHYPDSVCYSFYPIDLHVKNGIDQTHLADGVIPNIPYRALIPRGTRRILCAGRCVSSDTYANSALRVQASCMAMGQVSGCAAALCAGDGNTVRDADYTALCRTLESIGAIVPHS